MRRTKSSRAVATALLRDPQAKHWGYALIKDTGLKSGVLYPILRRMHDQGWLTDGWADVSEQSLHRPPRRYYRLTPPGIEALRTISTT